jgi:hypothetical protein
MTGLFFDKLRMSGADKFKLTLIAETSGDYGDSLFSAEAKVSVSDRRHCLTTVVRSNGVRTTSSSVSVYFSRMPATSSWEVPSFFLPA